MGNSRHSTGNSRRSTGNSRRSTGNSRRSMANSRRSTGNSRRSMANSHLLVVLAIQTQMRQPTMMMMGITTVRMTITHTITHHNHLSLFVGKGWSKKIQPARFSAPAVFISA
jgi:hypothetical protein